MTFDPDTLRAGLLPLQVRQPMSPLAQSYLDFYSLPPRGAVHNWMGRFEAAGFEVVGQVWQPAQPKATLILVHGFYDHMALYRHVIEWALGRHFTVISCDLPGHGLSSGARASIEDFADYQAVLDALLVQAQQCALPQPWHLCGQSMGGAIVIDHLLTAGEASLAQGRPILLAPLVRPRSWTWSRLSYRLLSPFVTGITRRFSENTNDPAFMPFLQADPLQPLRLPTAWVGALGPWIKRVETARPSRISPLVIQGQQDRTVDWRHNMRFIQERFDSPQVLYLPAARHHLANEIPSMRAGYFAFLERFL